MKRATIYLDENLHRALKIKSAEADQSISELVNNAVRTSLDDDLEDLADFDKRKKEKSISYQDFLKELKSRGQI